MRLRVVHAGTGLTGKEALRGILADPALELVGVYVTTADKVGADVGSLCGLPDVGLQAAGDFEEVLALGADCLCYAGTAVRREHGACEDMAAFLRRGTNVVTFSVIPLIYSPAGPADLREIIQSACIEGESSFYATGIEPGVGSLNVPTALLSCAGQVTHYQMDEYALNLDTIYPIWDVLHESMGFGKPAGFTPARISSGSVQTHWEPVVRYVADLLHATLDRIEFTWETTVAPEDLSTEVGTIPAGTICAFRWMLTGVVRGASAIVVQYICSISPDAYRPDHWPRPASDTRGGALAFTIGGRPNIRLQLYFDTQDGEETLNSSIPMTALAAVNAIPAVVGAKPGLLPPLVSAECVTRQAFQEAIPTR